MTVDVLKAGFAEGRLTQDEYNDRMGRAYAARTYGELAALTADLPAGPLPAWPVPAYQPPPPSGTNSMAIASMVLGVAEFFTAGLTAIPAVICGHVARRQMKQTAQRGDGLATSGLVLGLHGDHLLVGADRGLAGGRGDLDRAQRPAGSRPLSEPEKARGGAEPRRGTPLSRAVNAAEPRRKRRLGGAGRRTVGSGHVG